MLTHAPRAVLVAAALLLCTVLSACGGAASEPTASPQATDPTSPADGAAGGTCLRGTTDCIDTPELLGSEDLMPPELARQEAQRLLGVSEQELPPAVRVARRGDEERILTEDYVIGRITVELSESASGGYRVTSTTVELPDGPETFTATSGGGGD